MKKRIKLFVMILIIVWPLIIVSFSNMNSSKSVAGSEGMIVTFFKKVNYCSRNLNLDA